MGFLNLLTRRGSGTGLVRLPAGSYDLDVNWNGVHKHKTVEVGERRQYVMLEFPASADIR